MINNVRFLLDDKAICKAMSQSAKTAVSVRVLAAWATMGAGLNCLSSCTAARKEAIIGTRFSVTEPEALHGLIRQGFDLRILHSLRGGGTFHPKVYLFECPDGTWTALVGSANLTDAAFSRNAEVMVELSLTNEGAADLNALFDGHWKSAHPGKITDEWFERYKEGYEAAKQKRAQDIAKAERPKNSPLKRSTASPKTSQLQGLMKSDWAGYVRRLAVRKDLGDRFLDGGRSSYLRTLSLTGPILRSGLAEAEHEDISRAMGRSDYCGWLGTVHLISGRGAKIYRDRALRALVDRYLEPLWELRGEHQSLEAGRAAFASLGKIDGFGPGFITRMLTLARPDLFYSLNAASVDGLASLFGIPKARLRTWEGYEEGLKIVFATQWYNSPSPTDNKMKHLWDARVALLDAYAYVPSRR